ncbi:properdin [Python bivittatus]|uniref:Properdin n=1 Tax=Python bivittatus TaxID=176946 RepID=A0A9F2NHA8_PYTBI|nr:properdin [Python bivittatus]
MEILGLKRFQFLLVVCWFFVSLEAPAEAENTLCYKDFNEVSGTCSNLLGAEISKEDCCLNHQYGFQLKQGGPCQSCREAKWSEWTSWSACSVSCTEGVQRRSRSCYGYRPGTCLSGSREWEMKACVLKDCCPVMGGWSEWSNWKPCSVTCLTGTQLRERTCTKPAPNCGGTCQGDSRENRPCDTKQICPTHGNWGSWGSWQGCSKTCAIEGSATKPQQLRTRLCNNPSPSSNPPGMPCPGASQESRSCVGLPYCPQDGNWGIWKPLQSCSVTCGVGQILQRRLCDNPAPKHRGKDCSGESIRNQPCTIKVPCPVDGHWSEWSPWKPCGRMVLSYNIKCDDITGIQLRNRSCIGRHHAGKRCAGPLRESRACYNIEGCFMPGTWTDWSSWGLCEPACGPEPKRSRKRVCEPIYPNYSMVVEAENGRRDNVTFWGKPKAGCKPLDGQSKEVVEKLACQNVPPCEG